MFLKKALARGADKTYAARHRSPWYHVRLDGAAPRIVMTYMGRKPPRFALNQAGVPLLNIANGFFSKVPLSESQCARLVAWLNANVDLASGRKSAEGLVKF